MGGDKGKLFMLVALGVIVAAVTRPLINKVMPAGLTV